MVDRILSGSLSKKIKPKYKFSSSYKIFISDFSVGSLPSIGNLCLKSVIELANFHDSSERIPSI